MLLNILLPNEFQNGRIPNAELGSNFSLTNAVNVCISRLIRSALSQSAGIQTKASELLGTTRRILKYRMGKLNIRCNWTRYRPSGILQCPSLLPR